MNRSEYIGSSDARAILSGDWDKIYRKKLGLIPEDETPSFPMLLGQVTEDLHSGWTMKALVDETKIDFDWSLTVPDTDHQHFAIYNVQADGFDIPIGSHPDGLLRHPSGAVFPLELKITARWKNIDEVCQFYMPQIQHHLLAWGAQNCLVSAIIGTDEPARAWVGASPMYHDYYIERCTAFWTAVRERNQPGPMLFDTSKPIVPTAVADSVPINGLKRRCLDGDNHASALIADYIDTHAVVKKHEQIKADLKAMFADDEGELYHERLVMKKDKRGAVRMTIKDAA